MVSGPEIARINNEFELAHGLVKCKQSTNADTYHLIVSKGCQKGFTSQMMSCLVDTIEEIGNPFNETSQDLVKLDTKDIADDSVVKTVSEIERVRQEQNHSYHMLKIVWRKYRYPCLFQLRKRSYIFSAIKPYRQTRLPPVNRPSHH